MTWNSIYKFAAGVHLAPSYRLARQSWTADAYWRSYLSIRRLAGFIGLLMPSGLVLYDAVSIRGPGIDIRSSVSAYYYSDARDVFVGCLFAVGVLLLTYMAGHKRSADYWLSVLAGIGVLVVANMPTKRPGVAEGAPLCGSQPRPERCSYTSQWLGENLTFGLHVTGAGLFVVSSICLSVVFALREVYYAMDVANPDDAGNASAKRRFSYFIALATMTLLSGLVAIAGQARLGFAVGGLDNTWIGELGAFTSFAVSWLLAGRLLSAK